LLEIISLMFNKSILINKKNSQKKVFLLIIRENQE